MDHVKRETAGPRLPFNVNVMLNLSIILVIIIKRET